MITSVRQEDGKIRVRGIAQDDGAIAKVLVNDAEAKILTQHAGVPDWEVVAVGPLSAHAPDTGNEERWPHRIPPT